MLRNSSGVSVLSQLELLHYSGFANEDIIDYLKSRGAR